MDGISIRATCRYKEKSSGPSQVYELSGTQLQEQQKTIKQETEVKT